MEESASVEHNQIEQAGPPAEHLALYGLLTRLSPEVKQDVRAMKGGLFVHEARLGEVIEAYQLWLLEVSGGEAKRSEEKARKRLLGTERPVLHYVLDGNRCLPGMLLSAGSEPLERNRVGVAWSEAPLLRTDNYLHPRDPILSQLKGVSAQLKSAEGLRLELQVGEATFRVPEKSLANFARTLQESPRRKELQVEGNALRDAIRPLQKALAKAKPVAAKQTLLVPAAALKQKDARFLRFQTVVFAVHAPTSTLLDAYEPFGKNLRPFVDEELQLLGKKRVGAFLLTPQDCRFLGSIKLKGKNFRLHRRAFLEVVRDAGRSPTLRKKLRSRYTVEQCLDELGEVIKLADWVYFRDEKRKGSNNTKNRRLQFGPWSFETAEGFSITACKERGVERQRRSRPK